MKEVSSAQPRRRRTRRPILAGLATLAVLAVVLAVVLRRGGAEVGRGSTSSSPAPPSESSTVAASARPTVSPGALASDERTLAAAYLEVAEGFDRSSIDIQISQPLAEFDLVGTRLIDLLDRTVAQVAALPPSIRTDDAVRDLGVEMTATTSMLRSIDPHGPRDVAATRYREALDYWIDHVTPIVDAIRASLGLPTKPGGDLRL